MIREIGQLFADFKYGFARFIKYQLFTKGLFSILAMPLMSMLVEAIARSRGIYILTNYDIVRYGMTPQGVVTLCIMVIFAMFVLLVELGGLVLISHRVYFRQEGVSYLWLLRFCMSKVPGMFSVGGLSMLLIFFIAAPLMGITPYPSILQSLKIPSFILSSAENNAVLFAAEIVCGMLALFLAIRWIFSLHFMILEDRPPREALKKSANLVASNIGRFLWRFTFTSVLMMVLFGAVVAVWVLFTGIVSGYANYSTFWGRLILSTIFAVNQTGTLLATFIAFPIELLLLTRLFYQLRGISMSNPPAESKVGALKHTPIMDKFFGNKKLLFFTGISLFLAFTLLVSFFLQTMFEAKYDVKVVAHRGSSQEAPENTMAAILAAIRNGADYAEIDVQQSSDGKVFLCHDTNLKRITGINKNVWELTYDEISALDAGSHFGGNFTGQKMPLLEEVIDAARGKIKLNIEVKAGKHSQNLADNVVKIIESRNFINECVVTSLNYEALQRIRKLNPAIKIGYIMFLSRGNLRKLDVDFYSIEAAKVSENLVYEARSIGREVHVWTVNDENEMKRLIEIGVDAIITDDDKLLKAVINTMKTESPYYKFMDMLFNQ